MKVSLVAGPPQRLAPILWVLLLAFAARVAGQVAVAFFGADWLPAMEQWMSGLMPYRYLLPSQIVILALYFKICADFARGQGYFATPRTGLALPVLVFGCIYFAAMLVRGVAQLIGGFGVFIPVVFHFVLATFLILVGLWHWAHLKSPRAAT